MSLIELELPDKVEKLYAALYCCENLRTLYLPDSLRVLGGYTLFRCKNLVTIYLPNALEDIDPYAFNGCNSLQNIYYDGTVSDWQYVYKPIEGNSPLYDNYILCTRG